MKSLIKPQILPPERLFEFDHFAVVDIETTGLDPLREKIIEIACVLVVKDHIVGEFSLLMNPGIPIPDEVSKIHGLYDADVAPACSVEEGLSRFEFFVGSFPLLAHNAGFDFSFVQQALGYELPNPLFDSVALAKSILPWQTQYGLRALCTHFQIENERAHRALSDCRATAQVVLALKEMRKNPPPTSTGILYQVVEANTYAIRDQLKKAGFRWFKEHSFWGILLMQEESLNDNGEALIKGYRCRPFQDSLLAD